MLRGDSSLNMLIVAAILALGVGYYVPQTFSAKPNAGTASADSSKSADVANRVSQCATSACRLPSPDANSDLAIGSTSTR